MEVIGRPMTYETTKIFLYILIEQPEDLLTADELRRIPVTKPEHH